MNPDDLTKFPVSPMRVCFWLSPSGETYLVKGSHLFWVNTYFELDDPGYLEPFLRLGWVRGVVFPDHIHVDGPIPNLAQRRSLEALAFVQKKNVRWSGRTIIEGQNPENII